MKRGTLGLLEFIVGDRINTERVGVSGQWWSGRWRRGVRGGGGAGAIRGPGGGGAVRGPMGGGAAVRGPLGVGRQWARPGVRQYADRWVAAPL